MYERPISVLFVCHGNICRSPMAEFIFKALVKARGLDGRYRVASAAVSAEEIGNPIYPPAKRCLSQHGVAFDPDKRARQVSREDYDRYDRIICMDASNLRLIKRIIPAVTNEVVTLVKDTSMAFTVAYQEMFTIGKQIANSQTSFMPFVIAGVFYFVFNAIVGWVMGRFEKRLSYYR